jgi:hypothetical protein
LDVTLYETKNWFLQFFAVLFERDSQKPPLSDGEGG